jgi:N-acyl-D-amino-acid deacylase
MSLRVGIALFALHVTACAPAVRKVDMVIRNGTIYDGHGGAGVVGDVAIDKGRIVAVGRAPHMKGATEIDATGLAVAPGFINMLSWGVDDLLHDGRGQSDVLQGVTLEIFGEGFSYGPLDERMQKDMLAHQGDVKFDIPWTTLGGYLEHMVSRGVSMNVGSFIGADNPRAIVLGEEGRAPTAEEVVRMRAVVKQAMDEGAMGVASSLAYLPGGHAKTDELVALAAEAHAGGGMYISHIRDEGEKLLPAVDELIEIARRSGARAEIYHLKTSGEANWNKLDEVIRRFERARAQGLTITADIYPYIASSTGLEVTMPFWVREGGHEAWMARLRDPALRPKILAEMSTHPPDRIMLVGFKNPALRHYTGKRLDAIAAERGTSPYETILDLVLEDDSRIQTIYFTMSEDNLKKKMALPWVSFCSDSGALSPEGVFLNQQPHPRAYGSFARVLGKYVRDDKVLTLPDAIRKLTWLPATNLRLRERGALTPGYHADVVVFDPANIQDLATFEKPHQLATGVAHVFVNGVQVVNNGQHTGAKPGQVVRGPGWTGWKQN